MTWKELASKIAKMKPEQQEKPAMVWGEEICFSEIGSLRETIDDMYSDQSEIYCGSELTREEIEADMIFVCEKGTKYLQTD